MNLIEVKELADKVKANINKVIVGKEETIDHLFVALISSGHVLLEDVPGTGKTMIAKAMAKSLSSSFKRIQFTPDLLPTDVSGLNFYNQKEGEFEFREGPIFGNIILADEINRATPRTQSVLLECMEERQVTIDGVTRQLERPFLVIATQNPIENQGTFPLPEAQLDRFLLKINLGYPTKEEGVHILKRFKEKNPMEEMQAVATNELIVAAQQLYSSVYVSDEIYTYIVSLIEKTRNHDEIELGVSPRGAQAILKAVQVVAIINGRDYVLPDDVKAMVNPVLAHRLVLKHSMRLKKNQANMILDQILNEVPVPSEAAILKEIER
ncbi:AAA family ATPase [Evansella cellulosilytica]|uniref:ATPase associated with various cellular activities AAA_3 n=1 Tax=Evansella cellulosilytica (strain ATCC 21833 / DSM 2522 / FERM P-1141 / JCM 9156 / N-4) TaxID=649639 RepID=E6U0E4_EVAC2|nr:MoxR family ATPase [Evansella cellulosilytica]ADU30260.1 ATPase associated with various cellular activities AAA_3 [Evansella cellulosilytica DSM 2522]